MFNRRFRLPSPALVLSMVALAIALGGTAFAANTVVTAKHKHKDAKADKKLVKKMAPKLSVKHAKTANSATTAASATHATSADTATNAGHATSADSATNATHATSADSATNATHATSATNAANATHATTADTAANANTIGGKKVQQFFVNQAASTAAATVLSVDGVTLKGSCDASTNPHLTVQNDSGQGAMLGGYSSSSGVGNVVNGNFTATPVDLTGGLNGGGLFTVQIANGVVVSVQFAATGTLGGIGTHCFFSGSVIAS